MSARLFVILLAAVLVLTACDPQGGSKPEAPEPAADQTAAPEPGGHLIVGVYGEPATFDPFSRDASDLTYALARPLYRSLYRLDDSGEAVPDLAGALRTSGDIATITLQEATWSDGTTITSRDVAWSLRRAAGSAAMNVESVRPAGPRRVVVTGRVADWEEALAGMSYVLPRDGRRAYSGPFVLRSRVDGLQMVLGPNPETEDAPLLDRLTIRFTEGVDMLLALLDAGEIDAASLPSTVNLAERLDELGLTHDAELGWEIVVLDLSDSDLTRAQRAPIARAVDRRKMAEAFVRDHGRVTDTLQPVPGEGGASGPFETVFRGGADVDDLPLRLAAPSGDELLELVQRLAQVQLASAGFDVELINVDARRFYGEWGNEAPVDGAVRRRAVAPGRPPASPRALIELPLFQVDSFLAWGPGVGEMRAGGPGGAFARAHEWHLLP